jgi:uncharacterized protein YrrD
MLHNAEDALGYSLDADDGEIGEIDDLYFDDRFWTIRYLVVNTGSWLAGRRVLISPYAVSSMDEKAQTIATNLTKAQVENSPPASEAVPVSRQFETSISDYYGWPFYWYGTGGWGGYTVPPVPLEPAASEEDQESWDSDLRSVREVKGYRVAASDGDIGHVTDFLIEDKSWVIRYLVVDTRNWWPGRHVLVSWEWAEAVDWGERTVSVKLTREAIKSAPEYDRDASVTREYEMDLCRHYGEEGYWSGEACGPNGE